MKTRLLAALAFVLGLLWVNLFILACAKPVAAHHRSTDQNPANRVDPVDRATVAEGCPFPLPDGMCTYHGDLHSHTDYSDGQGTPQQAFQMARDNGLDFLAITDHAFMLTADEWNDIGAQAQAATVDDVFVALRGFEWTSDNGHMDVFNTNHLIRASDPDYDRLDEFYAWLSDPGQLSAVAQFNHPYYPGNAFNDLAYDQMTDPHINLVELEDSLYLRVGKYNAALASGWHVAPTNNSDTHEADWGTRRGRTGVVAPGLTYHHIIDALRARRLFASQDEDMALVMRADGYWMGSVVHNGPFAFEVYVFDPDPHDPIASLEFYQNGNLLNSTSVNTHTFTWRFLIPPPHPFGTWWYAKAIQSDGDSAYTSPIWKHQPKPYDVLIRDSMWDVGELPSPEPSWQSPDIWVRRQADEEIWHQNPAAGETNYVYARLQNIGFNPLTDIDVYFYWAAPTLGLTWPEGWHPINLAPLRIPELNPNETVIINIPWNVPTSAPEHSCLLVRLVSDQDPILYEGFAGWDNNIGLKNIHIVDAMGGSTTPGILFTDNLVFYLANPFAEDKLADIHFSSSQFPDQGSLVLHLDAQLFERWMTSAMSGSVKGAFVDADAKTITITNPADAIVYGLPLQAMEYVTTTLALAVPTTATLNLQVSGHIDAEEIGGNLYTTPSSQAIRRIDFKAALDSIVISRSVELSAVVVGEGFVPAQDGTEVWFDTTLGSLSAESSLTQNGIATVTLVAGATTGAAIVQASVGGTVTGTTVVNIYRTCWARVNDDPTDYLSVQAAVDATQLPTDVVKLAGHCSTINTRGDLAQVAYISKTVTLRGGYTTTQWTTLDPLDNPTTLDAQGGGRVLTIIGNISPTIENLRITGGDATGLGGGPSGADAGGGISIVSATATVSGTWVFRNSADVGGGLFLSASDAQLLNSMVTDNQATESGSGLYIAGSSARLLHTTIARNGLAAASTSRSGEALISKADGDGSGVYVTDIGPGYSTLALTNTILVSHTIGLIVTAGNTTTLRATLWGTATWANADDWAGTGLIDIGELNIWGDPAFACNGRSRPCTVSPEAGDYHIGIDSAALDAGVGAGVKHDIDRDTRTDGRPDLGADELFSAIQALKRADPDPAIAGDRVTYTIRVTNTGDTDLHTIITDTLPTNIMPSTATSGALISPGGTLTWTPTITTPGGLWEQTIVVTVDVGYVGLLTNVVHVTTDEGPTAVFTETSTAYVEHRIYLPVLMHNFATGFCAPRLIAEFTVGPEPRQVALDPVGQRAFVAHADGITVLDAHRLAVVTQTQSLTSAHGIAYDPDRDRIWITRMEADRVVVLDGETYAVLADLPAGHEPHSVAYNPANGYVYVTNWRDWTVSVYSAETLTQVVELTDFAEPGHVAVNPETNKIYVANHRPGTHVTVIDGATHESHQIRTALIDAYGVAVDPLRQRVYVTAIAHGRISVIDGATDMELGYLDVRRNSGERVPLRVIAVNPDMGPQGHLLVVTSSEDGGHDQLLLIPNGWPIWGTPIPVDLASYPLEGIAVDLTSDRVWVTSVDSGLVSVVRDGEPICSTPFTADESKKGRYHIEVVTNPLH